jgi:hypothetical protein
VSDTLAALSATLEAMAPLTKGMQKKQAPNQQSNTTPTPTICMLEDWIHFVRRSLSDENSRLLCFYRFTRGLTKAYCSLLLQDGLEQQYSSSLVEAQVDIQTILGVVESFVSFPLSAETIYFKIKRRLRDTLVDDGLLSPRIIATEVANHIKQLGLEILDYSLAAIGGPVMLPYTRRILRICYASILTSCAGPVRKVMDPTSVAQLEGKKRRWLHLSVTMRAHTIRSFERVVAMFGCDENSGCSSGSIPKARVRAPLATTDGERAVALVIGCLVEQIGVKKSQVGEFDDDWGSTEERVDLVIASANCLDASIVSCGGFLPVALRSLIESIVTTALLGLNGTQNLMLPILTWATVKVSLLRLACSCVATPWRDGASSSLVELLTDAAQNLQNDTDVDVVITAKSVLRVCDAIGTPRAPALQYISRAISSDHATIDVSSLVKGIGSARDEDMQAKRRLNDLEQAKKEKKIEEKRSREEAERQEKANKRHKFKAINMNNEARGEIVTEKNSTVESSVDAAPSSTPLEPDKKENAEISQKQEAKVSLALIEKDGVEDNDECISNDGPSDNNESMLENEGPSASSEGRKPEADNVDKSPDHNVGYDDEDDEGLPEIFDGGPDSDDE